LESLAFANKKSVEHLVYDSLSGLKISSYKINIAEEITILHCSSAIKAIHFSQADKSLTTKTRLRAGTPHYGVQARSHKETNFLHYNLKPKT